MCPVLGKLRRRGGKRRVLKSNKSRRVNSGVMAI